mmetsp:Transcript_137353/g.342537  ORF Transcript_137353/g.342537 Transcript_137353/m.342537 type:complete len:237 (+) Transcript_137353:1508-2218(+)
MQLHASRRHPAAPPRLFSVRPQGLRTPRLRAAPWVVRPLCCLAMALPLKLSSSTRTNILAPLRHLTRHRASSRRPAAQPPLISARAPQPARKRPRCADLSAVQTVWCWARTALLRTSRNAKPSARWPSRRLKHCLASHKHQAVRRASSWEVMAPTWFPSCQWRAALGRHQAVRAASSSVGTTHTRSWRGSQPTSLRTEPVRTVGIPSPTGPQPVSITHPVVPPRSVSVMSRATRRF